MCFNRRRSTYTLGDFQNTSNSVVARVKPRSSLRQESDVFERDPFKVQSFNFRYAEKPSNLGLPNQNQTFQFHYPNRTRDAKPFQTHFYNHGFNITRHDKNYSEASESSGLRGRKHEEPQASTGTSTNLLYKPTHWSNYTTTADSQQTDTQRQQWSYKSPSCVYNQSNNTNEQKLSSYFERRQAARHNKSANTSTTSLSTLHQQQQQHQQPPQLHKVRSFQLPQWLCGNEERISPADAAARARQAARGSSKAMAAAVGTIGKTTNATNNNEGPKTKKAATSATARKFSSGSVSSSFTPLIPNRSNISSWRSCPTTEHPRFTRGSCSTSVLSKENTNSNTQQPRQQHNQPSSGPQQRRLVQQNMETMVNRCVSKTAASRTVVQRCNSCEISINIKGNQPRQPKNDNVVIKIESAAPFKVVSNAGCGTSRAANIRSKRLNNLMSQKNITYATPHNINITPKASTGTVEMNKRQSKHSVSSLDSCNISQRVLNCERFIEREGERLRQKAIVSSAPRKACDNGHILGSISTRNRSSLESVPWVKSTVAARPTVAASPTDSSRVAPKAKPTANVLPEDSITSQRLRSICDRGLTSLHQLRASIDAISTTSKRINSFRSSRPPVQPLKRSSTAPRLNIVCESSRLSRQTSTSTFTLSKRNNFAKTARSITPLSARGDVSSCRGRVLNSS